ncbi:hypothetical protein CU097_012594 [Rhizopus azygosporus]|nr:hypothetical protein CU097_012594 [Rhizopus azygosporus]
MSSTLHISPYKPVSDKVTVPIDQMEQILSIFPETYAVKVHTAREQIDSEAVSLNAEGIPVKKEKITVLYLSCKHPRKGKSGVIQSIQKASKTITCEEAVVNEAVTNPGNQTNELSNTLTAYRSYLDNTCLLNNKVLAHVKDAALVIKNVITRNNNNQIPLNQRHISQKR